MFIIAEPHRPVRGRLVGIYRLYRDRLNGGRLRLLCGAPPMVRGSFRKDGQASIGYANGLFFGIDGDCIQFAWPRP